MSMVAGRIRHAAAALRDSPWFWAFLLTLLLVAIYREALIRDYYFADDVWTYPDRIRGTVGTNTYASHGRPITDFLLYLAAYTYYVFDSAQLARLLSVLLLAGTCLCIFAAARPLWGSWRAFLVALTIACVPAFQIHVTYARIFTYLIGYILAYVAVEAVYAARLRQWQAWTIFAVAILVSYHLFQACPFFVLVFLLIRAMRWPAIDAAAVRRLAVAVAVLAVLVVASAAAHMMVMKLTGTPVYKKAEGLVGALSGDLHALALLGLRHATNVFELWTYPSPFPARGAAAAIRQAHFVAAAAIMALAVLRVATSPHRWRDGLVLAVAGLFFAASLVPVAASQFDGRQHMYAAPQAILVLVLFWSLYAMPLGRIAATVLTVLAVATTAVGFADKLVDPHAFALKYARAALREVPRSATVEVVVVRPSRKADRCRYQPCSGFYSRNLNALTRRMYLYTKTRGRGPTVVRAAVIERAELEATLAAIGRDHAVVVVDVDKALAAYRRHRPL